MPLILQLFSATTHRFLEEQVSIFLKYQEHQLAKPLLQVILKERSVM